MLIGVTGQIGGGKTTAAKILAELGAHVIDADRIARDVVNRSEQLRWRLADRFGHEILDKRGRLNRRKLAQIAFASERERHALNRLVHPYVVRELQEQKKSAVKKHDLVVIDAPLLLDRNLDRQMDYVLVIHASIEIRLARLVKRGISRSDSLARQKAQLPYREFQQRSDRLILNNGTTEQLRVKLVRFLNRIHPRSR